MRFGDGTGVAYTSAFGGSSAVNYGITAQPEDSAFTGWPISASDLHPHFERARSMLQASPNPAGDELGDKAFLDLVEPGHRVDLENTIDWERCTLCGRCVPGCNEDAKLGLEKTYLAKAMEDGVEVRLETEVCDVQPLADGGYAVELRAVSPSGQNEWVRARHVVLAAGTLGTLDLLQRVRGHLPLGDRFGQRVGLNGDGLAFLYNTAHRLSSHSGAPISTSVRLPYSARDGTTRTLTVMSGRVPMAAMRFAGAALSIASGLAGESGQRAPWFSLDLWRRRLRDLVTVDERGALSQSFMYKLDGQDESRGIARFDAAGTVIDWPDYADDPIMLFAEERLREWARRVGGRVVPNIARLPGMRSLSVHPLGGCRMGTSVEDGVVDTVGRVFDPRGGIYEGLRIADGSIFAGSIGVPPSLTIAALAERIAQDLLSRL